MPFGWSISPTWRRWAFSSSSLFGALFLYIYTVEYGYICIRRIFKHQNLMDEFYYIPLYTKVLYWYLHQTDFRIDFTDGTKVMPNIRIPLYSTGYLVHTHSTVEYRLLRLYTDICIKFADGTKVIQFIRIPLYYILRQRDLHTSWSSSSCIPFFLPRRV